MKERSFHTRGFVSLLAFGTFIVMTFNGIVLYFAPQGMIAYWVDWRFLGVTRESWVNMHLISSILFAVAGLAHLLYNWKPILNYVSQKISGGLRLRRELIIASALSVFVILGPIYQTPPLDSVINFGSYLKKAWIVSRDYEPPFGHAEAVSLKTFTKRMNIDFEKAVRELKDKGIQVEGGETSLEKIAKVNHTSSMKVYMIIQKFEQAPEVVKRGAYTAEMVEEKFSGMGIGRKTLAEMCKETGVALAKAKENLLKNKIEMKDDETLKDAAGMSKLNSIDVLKIILVDDFKLK